WIAPYVGLFASIHFSKELVFAAPPTQWQSATILISAVVAAGTLVGFWGGLLMLFWPGRKGENRYGPDPLSKSADPAVG
ncbi:MAG: hypothetical protein FD124_3440, partial [Alphaproteobacteria bacterium]